MTYYEHVVALVILTTRKFYTAFEISSSLYSELVYKIILGNYHQSKLAQFLNYQKQPSFNS